jgi:branched-chain amino acid transport system permease protein
MIVYYLYAIATQMSIYALLALGLNLQWGHAGLLNFGIVASFAIGAYGAALTATLTGWPVAASALVGVVLAVVVAYPIGLASVRLRAPHYLAVVTVGFGESVRVFATTETWITNGTRGISVPRPFASLPGRGSDVVMAVIAVAVVAVVYVAIERLIRSPFGRTLEAIRDDEDSARSLGKPVAGFKIRAFVLGSAIAGLAGAVQAFYSGFLVPEQFTPLLTFYVWLAVVLGGTGSGRGAILGAGILVVFLEGSRFLRDLLPPGVLSDSQMASLRFVVIGVALIVIPLRFPRGLLGPRGRR